MLFCCRDRFLKLHISILCSLTLSDLEGHYDVCSVLGDTFSVGYHAAVYSAWDEQGNRASCHFDIFARRRYSSPSRF